MTRMEELADLRPLMAEWRDRKERAANIPRLQLVTVTEAEAICPICGGPRTWTAERCKACAAAKHSATMLAWWKRKREGK